MSKIKPQWMASYAIRSRRTRQTGYGDNNNYGVNSVKVKAMSSTANSRSTRESKDPSLFVSTKELGSTNYRRLGDNDIEMAMPAPPSPSFQVDRSRLDDTGSSTDGGSTFGAVYTGVPREEKQDIPMQSLNSRSKPQPPSQSTDNTEARREFSNRGKENDKAMEILGMDHDTGVTTHIMADNKGQSSIFPQHLRSVSKSKSGASVSGIEVKMDVTVSSTPSPVTRPKDASQRRSDL